MHLAIARKMLLDEGHDLGRELVRTFGSALAGKQPAQPIAGEGGLGLIEGWPRQTE